ncbi:MAG: hypothetical protein M3O22_03125 [Pseudomonadota bacterium]|nr:hypothetical protein [Pseudomonadota bacterium]
MPEAIKFNLLQRILNFRGTLVDDWKGEKDGGGVFLADKDLDRLAPHAALFAGYGYMDLFRKLWERVPADQTLDVLKEAINNALTHGRIPVFRELASMASHRTLEKIFRADRFRIFWTAYITESLRSVRTADALVSEAAKASGTSLVLDALRALDPPAFKWLDLYEEHEELLNSQVRRDLLAKDTPTDLFLKHWDNGRNYGKLDALEQQMVREFRQRAIRNMLRDPPVTLPSGHSHGPEDEPDILPALEKARETRQILKPVDMSAEPDPAGPDQDQALMDRIMDRLRRENPDNPELHRKKQLERTRPSRSFPPGQDFIELPGLEGRRIRRSWLRDRLHSPGIFARHPEFFCKLMATFSGLKDNLQKQPSLNTLRIFTAPVRNPDLQAYLTAGLVQDQTVNEAAIEAINRDRSLLEQERDTTGGTNALDRATLKVLFEKLEAKGDPDILRWKKEAGYYPPDMTLAGHSPSGFRRDIYQELFPVLVMAGRMEDSFYPELNCYVLSVLFKKGPQARAYLDRYQEKWAGQSLTPVEDACLMDIPREGTWTPEFWGQMISQHGPAVSRYIGMAVQIEALVFVKHPDSEKLSQEQRAAVLKTALPSPEKIKELADRVGYLRQDENPRFARACLKNAVPSEIFEEGLPVLEKPRMLHHLPDPGIIDGAEIGHPGFYMRKLAPDDPTALIMGYILHNCQRLGKQGEAAAIHAATSPYGGFYVWHKKQDPDAAPDPDKDRVVAASWGWIGKDNALVFDTFDPVKHLEGHPAYAKMGQDFLEEFSYRVQQGKPVLVDGKPLSSVRLGHGDNKATQAIAEKCGAINDVDQLSTPRDYDPRNLRYSRQEGEQHIIEPVCHSNPAARPALEQRAKALAAPGTST